MTSSEQFKRNFPNLAEWLIHARASGEPISCGPGKLAPVDLYAKVIGATQGVEPPFTTEYKRKI